MEHGAPPHLRWDLVLVSSGDTLELILDVHLIQMIIMTGWLLTERVELNSGSHGAVHEILMSNTSLWVDLEELDSFGFDLMLFMLVRIRTQENLADLGSLGEFRVRWMKVNVLL